jgi:hypothetical protein
MSYDNSIPKGQPLFLIEIMDATLRGLVQTGKAECLHDGSKTFVAFRGEVANKSKRYFKRYDIFTTVHGDLVDKGNWLTSQRRRIELFFNHTTNRGFIKVNRDDKNTLDKIGILQYDDRTEVITDATVIKQPRPI